LWVLSPRPGPIELPACRRRAFGTAHRDVTCFHGSPCTEYLGQQNDLPHHHAPCQLPSLSLFSPLLPGSRQRMISAPCTQPAIGRYLAECFEFQPACRIGSAWGKHLQSQQTGDQCCPSRSCKSSLNLPPGENNPRLRDGGSINHVPASPLHLSTGFGAVLQ
jgi:hypothetical protein